MPGVIFDEFRIVFATASKTPSAKADLMHRTLISRRFRGELSRAIRAIVGQYPELRRLKTTVSV